VEYGYEILAELAGIHPLLWHGIRFSNYHSDANGGRELTSAISRLAVFSLVPVGIAVREERSNVNSDSKALRNDSNRR
jgi:hypothetical protein